MQHSTRSASGQQYGRGQQEKIHVGVEQGRPIRAIVPRQKTENGSWMVGGRRDQGREGSSGMWTK